MHPLAGDRCRLAYSNRAVQIGVCLEIAYWWCWMSGTFRNPQPLVVSQKYRRYKWEVYCGTNGRRTAVQIGGVLLRFPFSKALKPARHSVTNGGAYCGTNWRSTASTFHTSCTGWGFLYSGGPKGGHLKGDMWKWDFALKIALENGISLWSSHSTRQFSLLFLRKFRRESTV